MKQQDIKVLIGKFYQGETTPDEENIIRSYLINNNDYEYEYLRSQFKIMDEISSKEESLDISFDEKILKQLKVKNKPLYLKYSLSGVAAVILLLISVWVGSSILSPKEVYGTITNPQIAFAETKKALQKVSGNVNKGVKPATNIINKADTGIEKTKNLKKIKKINNAGLLLESMTKVNVNLRKL